MSSRHAAEEEFILALLHERSPLTFTSINAACREKLLSGYRTVDYVLRSLRSRGLIEPAPRKKGWRLVQAPQ